MASTNFNPNLFANICTQTVENDWERMEGEDKSWEASISVKTVKLGNRMVAIFADVLTPFLTLQLKQDSSGFIINAMKRDEQVVDEQFRGLPQQYLDALNTLTEDWTIAGEVHSKQDSDGKIYQAYQALFRMGVEANARLDFNKDRVGIIGPDEEFEKLRSVFQSFIPPLEARRDAAQG